MRGAVEMIKTICKLWVHPVHPTTTLSWHLVSNDQKNPVYIPDLKPIEVDYQGKKFKLRTLYNIVGWIFSVVGYVPGDQRNLLLPPNDDCLRFLQKAGPRR